MDMEISKKLWTTRCAIIKACYFNLYHLSWLLLIYMRMQVPGFSGCIKEISV